MAEDAYSKQMRPLEGDYTYKVKTTSRTVDEDTGEEKTEYFSDSFTIKNGDSIMHSNGFFDPYTSELTMYEKFNRFGWINPYDVEPVTREFLFVTKPDLCIYGEWNDDVNYYNQNSITLNSSLASVPFFKDMDERHRQSLLQLQRSVRDSNNTRNPFMYLLSNTVTSKLDLPSISADSKESTSNLYGHSIQYRGHSIKGDNGYDFSLSVTDTSSLAVYNMVKAYDEYIRLMKTGACAPKKKYIIQHILPEQFSIYKFLIGADGETILYFAKLTGVYFTDVPRSDMSDPDNQFKYSLSMHAQFVEDSDIKILNDFNRVASELNLSTDNLQNTFNSNTGMINNNFVKRPVIKSYKDARAERHHTGKDYRLMWA